MFTFRWPLVFCPYPFIFFILLLIFWTMLTYLKIFNCIKMSCYYFNFLPSSSLSNSLHPFSVSDVQSLNFICIFFLAYAYFLFYHKNFHFDGPFNLWSTVMYIACKNLFARDPSLYILIVAVCYTLVRRSPWLMV